MSIRKIGVNISRPVCLHPFSIRSPETHLLSRIEDQINAGSLLDDRAVIRRRTHPETSIAYEKRGDVTPWPVDVGTAYRAGY